MEPVRHIPIVRKHERWLVHLGSFCTAYRVLLSSMQGGPALVVRPHMSETHSLRRYLTSTHPPPIFLQDGTTMASTVVHPRTRVCSILWSPDGKRVLVSTVGTSYQCVAPCMPQSEAPPHTSLSLSTPFFSFQHLIFPQASMRQSRGPGKAGKHTAAPSTLLYGVPVAAFYCGPLPENTCCASFPYVLQRWPMGFPESRVLLGPPLASSVVVSF